MNFLIIFIVKKKMKIIRRRKLHESFERLEHVHGQVFARVWTGHVWFHRRQRNDGTLNSRGTDINAVSVVWLGMRGHDTTPLRKVIIVSNYSSSQATLIWTLDGNYVSQACKLPIFQRIARGG